MTRRSTSLLLAAALAGVLWVQLGFRCGDKGLWSRGEGRVALIARTMLDRGDWVVPRVGDRPLLTKPPMAHWAVAASLAVGGMNETAARFPLLLAAAATVVMTGWIAARIYGGAAGWAAAFILAATPQFARQARTMQIDIMLAFWVVAVLCAWIRWETAGAPRAARGWQAVGWAATAGAFLTKGPVGLAIPGLIVLLSTVGLRPVWAPSGRRVSWFGAAWWLLFVALAIPWYAAVTARLGGMDFLRGFLSGDLGQELGFAQPAGHAQPWWYYVPRVIGDFAPWSLFLPLAFGVACRVERSDAGPSLRRLTPVWVLVVFVGYSLLGKKTARYLLPLYPALAITVGAAWADTARAFPTGCRERGFRWLIAGIGAVVGVVSLVLLDLSTGARLLGIPMIRDALSQKDLWTAQALAPALADHRIAAVTLCVALVGAVGIAVVLWIRRRPLWTFACLVAGVTGLAAIYYAAVVPILDRDRSIRPVAVSVRALTGDADQVAAISSHAYSFQYPFPFYVGRPVAWYPDVPAFAAAVAARPDDRDEASLPTLVVLPADERGLLRAACGDRATPGPEPVGRFRDREYVAVRLDRR